MRIFMTGATGVVGRRAGAASIDETGPIRPARYNRSMVDAEASAERVSRGGGTGIVLRFAGLYGPDGRGDPRCDQCRASRSGSRGPMTRRSNSIAPPRDMMSRT